MKNKINTLNIFLFSSLSLISLAQASNQTFYTDNDEDLQKALALSMQQDNEDKDLQKAIELSMRPNSTKINKNEKDLNKTLELSKKESDKAEQEALDRAIAASLDTPTNPTSNTTHIDDGVVAPVNPGLKARLDRLEQSRKLAQSSGNTTTNGAMDELAQKLQRRKDLNGEGR